MHAKILQNLAQTHCGLMQNNLKTTATTKPPAELAIKNPLKIKQREREKNSSDDFLIHNQPQKRTASIWLDIYHRVAAVSAWLTSALST